MALYALTASPATILRTSDGAFIPTDPANVDYQMYLAWVAAGNTPDAAPAPTLAQQSATMLATKMIAGIVLTSTSTPALNGTYALDDVSQGQIYQIGLYANQFGVFPSGGSTLEYPDASGTPHNFTVVEFVAFLKAVSALVSALTTQSGIMAHGGTPSWPSQSVTIA